MLLPSINDLCRQQEHSLGSSSGFLPPSQSAVSRLFANSSVSPGPCSPLRPLRASSSSTMEANDDSDIIEHHVEEEMEKRATRSHAASSSSFLESVTPSDREGHSGTQSSHRLLAYSDALISIIATVMVTQRSVHVEESVLQRALTRWQEGWWRITCIIIVVVVIIIPWEVGVWGKILTLYPTVYLTAVAGCWIMCWFLFSYKTYIKDTFIK